MTRTSCIQRAPESSWKAELLRLTTFHTASALAETQGWWREMTGSEPESVVNKPKGGEHAEVGRFEDWQLVLQVQTRPEARVDWIAGGFGDVDENLTTLPLETRLPLFIDPMKKWLRTTCPEIKRMAFGAIVNLDVDSREEGYRTCSNYLNFDLDPESSDFLYQINRRRPSKVLTGVTINRVMKWGVGVRQLGTLTIPFDGRPMESERDLQRHHCRLESDINTVPGAEKILPRERLSDLLDEMVQLLREIISEGDVP